MVKVSFFSPQNLEFFNSKLGRARTEELIDCGISSCGIVLPFLAHVLPEFHQPVIHEHFGSNIHSHQIVLMRILVTMGVSVSIWIFSGYKKFFNFSLIASCSRSKTSYAAFHCASFSSKNCCSLKGLSKSSNIGRRLLFRWWKTSMQLFKAII